MESPTGSFEYGAAGCIFLMSLMISRSFGPGSEAKYWTKLQYLIEEYAAGRRHGISQRVRINAEQRNPKDQVTTSATGWVFVKYGQSWVQFGAPSIKQVVEQIVHNISIPPTANTFLAEACKDIDGIAVDGYTLSAKVVDHLKGDGHSEFHSSNAFCGYAGEEEMRHFRWLIDQLTDAELKQLTQTLGIRFTDEDEATVTREQYENVIDEADREDFYREYHGTVTLKRVKKKT
jgi:hypothetical protein